MRHTNEPVIRETSNGPSAVGRLPHLTLEIEVLEARIAPGEPVLQFLGGPANLSPQNAFLPNVPHGEPIFP